MVLVCNNNDAPLMMSKHSNFGECFCLDLSPRREVLTKHEGSKNEFGRWVGFPSFANVQSENKSKNFVQQASPLYRCHVCGCNFSDLNSNSHTDASSCFHVCKFCKGEASECNQLGVAKAVKDKIYVSDRGTNRGNVVHSSKSKFVYKVTPPESEWHKYHDFSVYNLQEAFLAKHIFKRFASTVISFSPEDIAAVKDKETIPGLYKATVAKVLSAFESMSIKEVNCLVRKLLMGEKIDVDLFLRSSPPCGKIDINDPVHSLGPDLFDFTHNINLTTSESGKMFGAHTTSQLAALLYLLLSAFEHNYLFLAVENLRIFHRDKVQMFGYAFWDGTGQSPFLDKMSWLWPRAKCQNQDMNFNLSSI